ncbi:dihydroxyacetone kinase [Streptococcus varani]|jgi:dihydroxyacetone kinase|uniref:DhaKLM operon coactivator DhaQ n=1 Tax=Streptococcus varani TaxID=1608583 RepID=A0A0E4H504_9STRE|nr:DhaKLM operon coactivator DhaQ [Streptococcus varani]CQR24943.1 dihydroxyacetone kinase [Streptococcus varani]
MTFIMNQKREAIDSYIQASVAIHPHLEKHPNLPLVYLKDWDETKVPILSGGGSGHEPAHIGYVGQGMLTAAIYGQLFLPPTTPDILEAIRFLDKGKGVFIIVKNFEADLKEFSNAITQARLEGHHVRYVLSHDDISIEPKKKFQIRGRGLAGTILLHKRLGYASQEGASLQELEKIGFDLAPQIATIGFATKSATLFNAALPLFDLGQNEISYGIGIHGEEGYRVVPFQYSELLANEIINKLRLHFHWKKGDEFVLLVNNLGTTTEMEMGIFTQDILQLLEIEGIKVIFVKSGHFMTSLDMTGISVTLCRNKSLLEVLQAPTNAFAW